MESLPTNRHEDNDSPDTEQYLRALNLQITRYRQGEIRFEDVLYALNEGQRILYDQINPEGPDYNNTYRVAVTGDGTVYTKFLNSSELSLTQEQQRTNQLEELLDRIGSTLEPEVMSRARQAIKSPELTDEEFRTLLGDLLSHVISKLNGG